MLKFLLVVELFALGEFRLLPLLEESIKVGLDRAVVLGFERQSFLSETIFYFGCDLTFLRKQLSQIELLWSLLVLILIVPYL